MTRAAWVGLAMLGALGCARDVNDVSLILDPEGALGLSCTENGSDELLLERARGAATIDVSISLDYLGFEGVPSCRPLDLLEWCQRRGCPVVQRDCVDVTITDPAPGVPASAAVFQDAASEALAGMYPITADAPDGVVMIRMVVSRQSCAEVGRDAHTCDDLLGCVYSCPVQLDEVRGDVRLELDSLGMSCNATIAGICAGIGFSGGNCRR